jgi:hypothetical protein
MHSIRQLTETPDAAPRRRGLNYKIFLRKRAWKLVLLLYAMRLCGYVSEMPDVIFLIPSFQPGLLFPEFLEKLRSKGASPIVVVDDGSGPDYRELFARCGAIEKTVVLENAINLGKGAALKHGINYILVHFPNCTGVVMTCPRSFIQWRLESQRMLRRLARGEQRAIGGAGRGCAAGRTLR